MAVTARLGEQPAPAQIAVSVAELITLAVFPWVEAVVGTVPSMVKYGTLPAELQVMVAETGWAYAPPEGSSVGATQAGTIVAPPVAETPPVPCVPPVIARPPLPGAPRPPL